MLCASVYGEPKGRRRGGKEQRETGNGGLGFRGSAGYLLQWLAHSLQPQRLLPGTLFGQALMALWSQKPRLPVADQGAP